MLVTYRHTHTDAHTYEQHTNTQLERSAFSGEYSFISRHAAPVLAAACRELKAGELVECRNVLSIQANLCRPVLGKPPFGSERLELDRAAEH